MELFSLFLAFVKIGFTSFGGMSMIPLINSEMLDHGWMNAQEVADIVAIAEMTPGPLGLNCATFAGMRVAGFAGAVCANLGALLPSYSVAFLFSVGFEKWKKQSWMQNALYGLKPVCIGLIMTSMLSIGESSYIYGGQVQPVCVLLGICGVFLLLRKKWGIPIVIILAALAGVLVFR
ncbi:MAG TPA: chromate transporter [Candidatus Eisenbergiella stercorigallinarum]|uniref:Chromate transporter n=1 Tax=Candidatus Eisenbergiella stercorigallinarum TaxID=2838557 RepID=A0A9D2U1K7_9FIRM|nr:chromate transporter [Candidatus Eisenbergiella stercorigallinarum]